MNCLHTLSQQSPHLAAKLWSQVNDIICQHQKSVSSFVDAELSPDNINNPFVMLLYLLITSLLVLSALRILWPQMVIITHISVDEVLQQLQRLDVKKATGSDLCLPVAGNILEKLIASCLGMFLESHNFLHEHQGTYRHGTLSEQILLFAVDSIVHASDRGLVVCAACNKSRLRLSTL